MATEIIRSWIIDIKQIKTGSESYDFKKKYEKQINDVVKNIKAEDWAVIENLVVVCIQNGSHRVMQLTDKLLEKRKLIDWKAHPQVLEHWLDTLAECGVIPESANSELYSDGAYCDLIEKTVAIIKLNKLMKKFEEKLFRLVMAAIGSESNRLQIAVVNITTTMEWDRHPDWMVAAMERTYDMVRQYPDMSRKHTLARALSILWTMMFQKLRISQGKGAAKYVSQVSQVFHFCKEQEWVDTDNSDNNTLSYELLKTIMEDYLNANNTNAAILRPMMAGVKELWDCDDEILQRSANHIITGAASSQALQGDTDLVDEDTTETLLELYFSGQKPELIAQFSQMYPKHPAKFQARVDDFIEAMDGGPDWGYTTTILLMWEISKDSPESFSKDAIAAIANTLSLDNTQAIALIALNSLAEKRAVDVEVHDDAIIRCMKKHNNMSAQGGMVLVKLAALSEANARKYLQVLRELIPVCESTMAMGLMYNMRTIGSQNIRALAEHEEFFLEMRERPGLAEHVQGILDILAGRTLAGISLDVSEQREDIDNIENRVTVTEENVSNLGNELDQTRSDVIYVKQEVKKQEERLTEVEEVVEDTVGKVEELDGKTLSHAPMWSRDVAKLMNPQQEHDWRFLASRLAYGSDDIRNWATQPDPCLSLLDEWFATHKTRDATFAVLKALEEMNRPDAAMIVENALKQVEDTVIDEESDYATPPPVFISYQWGLQQEVKLLHRHLNMAGFQCWLDIGQMGGGDKLFEKIDQGIRAAKVVICCVSESYARSPNCNREVNLSVTLGKPVIPLLMEKMSWPPPGAMGPIFGEYLFIRFFGRPGESVAAGARVSEDGGGADQRYWPPAKYQELLMQLSYHVVPQLDLITKLYKDWWCPPKEVITITPKPHNSQNSGHNTQRNSTNKSEENASPDIFISYQWGKQPQIKALYSKLSSLGYSCWLDIMQMGGGDSLYDKIDKGVRGCKLMLSCVTNKYSLSANCRREVSLADALKKPIIPLLLDPSMPWPPEGPMSMVFTQLLYINFTKPDIEIQNHWGDSPQMVELLTKIKGIIPVLADENDENQVINEESVSRVDSNQNILAQENIDNVTNIEKKDLNEMHRITEAKEESSMSLPKDSMVIMQKSFDNGVKQRSKSCDIL